MFDRWFCRSNETLLGETGDDPCELVVLDECEDALLSGIVQVVNVKQIKLDSIQWKAEGGSDDPALITVENQDHSGTSFWYRFLYDNRHGRFEDPPIPPIVVENVKGCACCDRLANLRQREIPQFGAKLDSSGDAYESVTWHGLDLRPGDAIFLEPDSFAQRGPDGLIIKKEKEELSKEEDDTAYDDEMYPEKYRKTETIKGSNLDTPEPFSIGYIVSISYSETSRKFKIFPSLKLQLK